MNNILAVTICECAKKALAKRAAALTTPRCVVTDAQVATRIEWLAQAGYVPSADIAEPVRAYMQGYGLLLSGRAGCGKTMLMRLLMEHREELQHVDEILDWGSAGIRDWNSYRDGRGVCG